MYIVQIELKRKFSYSHFREHFAKIYFRFSRKFSYENNENFRENKINLDFFLIKLESTLTSGLWKRNFSFHLFMNPSHFDRLCEHGPREPGQDSQDRTVNVGF